MDYGGPLKSNGKRTKTRFRQAGRIYTAGSLPLRPGDPIKPRRAPCILAQGFLTPAHRACRMDDFQLAVIVVMGIPGTCPEGASQALCFLRVITNDGNKLPLPAYDEKLAEQRPKRSFQYPPNSFALSYLALQEAVRSIPDQAYFLLPRFIVSYWSPGLEMSSWRAARYFQIVVALSS